MKGQKGHFLCLFDTVEPKKLDTGADELFSDTQVRSNFFHGIQVKDSRQIGSM